MSLNITRTASSSPVSAQESGTHVLILSDDVFGTAHPISKYATRFSCLSVPEDDNPSRNEATLIVDLHSSQSRWAYFTRCIPSTLWNRQQIDCPYPFLCLPRFLNLLLSLSLLVSSTSFVVAAIDRFPFPQQATSSRMIDLLERLSRYHRLVKELVEGRPWQPLLFAERRRNLRPPMTLTKDLPFHSSFWQSIILHMCSYLIGLRLSVWLLPSTKECQDEALGMHYLPPGGGTPLCLNNACTFFPRLST